MRVPSLAQPAGADQGLYAYVGQRILDGEVPYRDAWDQKPPAIHYTYAAICALWPGDSDAVVATTDLIVAVATALLLLALGRRLGHSFTSTIEGGSWCGGIAALLFLLYTNPALTRLGGVRIRGQCEVFIALAVTAAFLLVLRACRAASERGRVPTAPVFGAGLLFGIAFLYKYNAGAYLIVGILALVLWRDDDDPVPDPFLTRAREAIAPAFTLIAGFAMIVGAAARLFHLAGALDDLYEATIAYNMFYSGETYSSPLHMAGYLLTFPILHARLDALWFLGGLGCAVLLFAGGPGAGAVGGADVGGGGVSVDCGERQPRAAAVFPAGGGADGAGGGMGGGAGLASHDADRADRHDRAAVDRRRARHQLRQGDRLHRLRSARVDRRR